MPGHKPIFVGLISSILVFFRDSLFKATIEPKSPKLRRAERIDKIKKDKKKGLKKSP